MLRLVRKFHLTDNPRADLLSGLTVAIALVPEAVAFALVAKIDPLIGLWAAAIVGLITAIFGGRSGMISGATGALAVVMVHLIEEGNMISPGSGVQYLFAALLLMGTIQIFAGIFRLGKFIRLVPYPVMLGFVNGLAIVIFKAQLENFKTADGWLASPEIMLMLAIIGVVMAIIFILPRYFTIIPATLIAIIVATLGSMILPWKSRTVGDLAGTIKGTLPQFGLPDVAWNFQTLELIAPYALIFAAIGLIESLLTLNLIDEKTETRGRASQECIGQGLANMTCGFFGAMGGCAMIGQSMININSGGRGRLSGIAAALFLVAFILVASPLVEIIPLAALVGVMVVVVIKTFAWPSIKLLKRIPKEDAFTIILVTIITVITDLAIAVVAGVVVSALVFAWKSARNIWIEEEYDAEKNIKLYTLHGGLFFGSVTSFKELFDVNNDADEVYIDFKHSRVWDHSAIEAIDALALRYKALGKKLHLLHLSEDCKLLLKNAKDIIMLNVVEDPHYRVFADYAKTIEQE